MFGKYGKIKLGDKIQFSNIKWLSMLISVGVGPSIFYSAIIDWAYISPIISELHKEPNLAAISYGVLHWGPIAWGICASLAVPIAIKQHLTKQPHNNISDCILSPKLGRSSRAEIIDSFTMIGLLCGASTTLTIGVLLISTCIAELFELNNNSQLKTILLILITLSFSASSILGLQKGMARLSIISIAGSKYDTESMLALTSHYRKKHNLTSTLILRVYDLIKNYLDGERNISCERCHYFKQYSS